MPAQVGVNGGDGTTQFENAVTVGTSDQILIAKRGNRKMLAIVNDSANVVYISTQGAASASTGVRLNANGGSVLYDRYVPQGAIRAIALTAPSVVLVTEGT